MLVNGSIPFLMLHNTFASPVERRSVGMWLQSIVFSMGSSAKRHL